MANGVTSKIVNASKPWARATPSTSKLVEVPKSVSVPPKIAPYDKGINNFDADIPSFEDNCTNTGIITTTTGVFDTTADDKTTNPIKPAKAAPGRTPACRSTWLVNQLKAPVRTKAPITMNMAAIVQGAGFDRTSSPFSYGKSPRTNIKATPPMATTSAVQRSHRNIRNMVPTTANARKAATSGEKSKIGVITRQVLPLSPNSTSAARGLG